ncbi:putative F-box protein At3g52320 [Setaria italica]|uniref:putative F-box protein At3g52320 n=1 Tax=Setaria italica TaxID=4555 RepID=UPI00035116EF|nr:putative F-box protein At3g52320 [Setaria italica]
MIQFSISWNSIQCAASAPSAGRLISAKASHMEGSSEPTMKDGDIGAPALPTEVLTEIFARLPSKSVGRFRCVSHAWCDTLTSPYFVELHYRRANQLVHPRLLLTPVGASYDSHLYSWRLGGYFVFNPSTGAVLPIPDIRAPLKRIFQMRKEHKVVRLFSNAEGGNGMTPTSCNCEVFVLDKPAYWRPSAAQPPLCSAMEKDPAVFIHGHLHFICSDGGGMTTFNISDETFGSLSPPSGACKVFSLDPDGSAPRILLNPDETIIGS